MGTAKAQTLTLPNDQMRAPQPSLGCSLFPVSSDPSKGVFSGSIGPVLGSPVRFRDRENRDHQSLRKGLHDPVQVPVMECREWLKATPFRGGKFAWRVTVAPMCEEPFASGFECGAFVWH